MCLRTHNVQQGASLGWVAVTAADIRVWLNWNSSGLQNRQYGSSSLSARAIYQQVCPPVSSDPEVHFISREACWFAAQSHKLGHAGSIPAPDTNGDVAQMEEQRSVKPLVVGSSPSVPAKRNYRRCDCA